MAKKTVAKVNPVTEALRKLKEEEAELLSKLKPVQEAISALENIIGGKSGKKESSPVGAKERESYVEEESAQEAGELFQ